MTDQTIVVDSDGVADAEPVDRPATLEAPDRVAATGRLAEQREPLIAEWARTRDGWARWLRWQAGHHGHVAAYHAIHLPQYAGRLAARTPRGLARTVRTACVWAADKDGRVALHQVVEAREPERYAKLAELHQETVRRRTALVALTTVAVALGGVAAWLSGDPAVQAIALVAAVGILGGIGRDRDKPIVTRAVVPTEVQPLTAHMVEQALVAAVPGVKDVDGVKWPHPIAIDGRGWLAIVDLPPAVTATAVMDKREELAGALNRPLGAVWLEHHAGDAPGRLHLWVGFEDVARRKPSPWPLATKGTVDLFESFPFGQDQRGRPVTITLMYASMVCGAVPRMGKTASMRLRLLAAALDDDAELHIYDLKGTGDFSALEPVAHRYRAGDDEDDIDYAIVDLRGLRDEMRRRSKVIRELPRSQCPDGKVTAELAARRPLRLHPIVLAVDECQLWFGHDRYGSSTNSKGEFEAIVEDLTKRGPALGIFVDLATQEPSKASLPTSISRNAILRFCLKVMDQTANDAVLGTSAYKHGRRATQFARRDVGVGILAGEGEEPRVVRAYFVDNHQAETVVARARALRDNAGTLSGHAVGETPDTPDDRTRLLADILAVVPAGEDRVWSETICVRLGDRWPNRYGGWQAEQLAAALRPYRIETGRQIYRTVDGEGRNKRGIHREDVADALRAERGPVVDVA